MASARKPSTRRTSEINLDDRLCWSCSERMNWVDREGNNWGDSKMSNERVVAQAIKHISNMRE